MKNKTIVLLFSLILIGLGLIFSIKYLVKLQLPTISVLSKIEIPTVDQQLDGYFNGAQQSVSSSEIKIGAASGFYLNKEYLYNPDYLLDRMFLKDNWFYRYSDRYMIISDKNVKVFEKIIPVSSPQLSHEFTLQYPQFSGFSNAANEEKLNKRIEEEVKKELKLLYEVVKIKRTFPYGYLGFRWDASISKTGLVSMRLFFEHFYDSKFNEETKIVPFSYDMISGQELSFKDFFTSENDFVSRIENFAHKQNIEEFKLGVAPEVVTSTESIVDLKSCLITERGVACQDKDMRFWFSMEWKDLEDIINHKVADKFREYSVKPQSSIIETTSTIDLSTNNVSGAGLNAYSEPADSNCPMGALAAVSKNYCLDKIFSKDYLPHENIDFDNPESSIEVYTGNIFQSIISSDKNIKAIEKKISMYSVPLRYDIDFSYPQFSGFSSHVNEEKLNKRIEQEVGKVLKGFQDHVKKYNIKNYGGKFNDNHLAIKWDIYISKDDLVSARLIFGEVFEPRYDINTNIISFSYDMLSGKELSLKDLFVSKSDFASRIENNFIKQKQSLVDSGKLNYYFESEFNTSTKKARDLRNCLMTELGVACSVPEYVPSEAMQFSIKWKDLEDLLNPEVVNRLRE